MEAELSAFLRGFGLGLSEHGSSEDIEKVAWNDNWIDMQDDQRGFLSGFVGELFPHLMEKEAFVAPAARAGVRSALPWLRGMFSVTPAAEKAMADLSIKNIMKTAPEVWRGAGFFPKAVAVGFPAHAAYEAYTGEGPWENVAAQAMLSPFHLATRGMLFPALASMGAGQAADLVHQWRTGGQAQQMPQMPQMPQQTPIVPQQRPWVEAKSGLGYYDSGTGRFHLKSQLGDYLDRMDDLKGTV